MGGYRAGMPVLRSVILAASRNATVERLVAGAPLSRSVVRRFVAGEDTTDAGTTVTLDMEDHTTTDRTLATLRSLRRDFPDTGAVVQAHLHRTEDDCRALAGQGSRVRLCKGAYEEPPSVAFQTAERGRRVVRPLPRGA